MDLSMLSPEEKEILRAALNEQPSESHGDIDDDRAFLEPIVKALQLLTEKVEMLEKVVMDDIIGGVKSLYDENVRKTSIDELRGKYGSMFDPLEPAWKEMNEGGDLYEKLYEIVEKLRGEEGYTDEIGDEKIKDIAGKLGEKVKKISEIKPEGEKIVEVQAIGEPDKLAGMLDRIKSQKARSKGVNIFE